MVRKATIKQLPTTRQFVQRALMARRFDHGAKRPRRLVQGRSRSAGFGADFLFEKDAILVREEFFEKVCEILAKLYLLPADEDRRRRRPVLAGIRLLRLRRDVNPQLSELEILGLIHDGGKRTINRPPDDSKRGRSRRATEKVTVIGLGRGVAGLNHAIHLCGNGAGCPADEPEPLPVMSSPWPGFSTDRGAGEGVKVVVVDTGFDKSARKRSKWLKGVRGDNDYAINGSTLAEYAGHGTFIAGIIKCVAPRAEVVVRQVFGFGGAALESDLVARLDDILEEDHPDIISMSAGTRAYDASGPLTFPVFAERLSRHKGVVMVVAAGNDGDREPFWPAASPYTVSVGALGTHWRGIAAFSNYGGWVDVYAPGQELVNAFPEGTYTYNEPPFAMPGQAARVEQFYGMARWSGTSFSTPIVAGLVAARMSHTGENGQEAAAALIAEAQAAAQPGVGAVLLPD
ncbi:S8/S53 family peptidase [Kribbella sp. NPDC026611]|uniref:S8 family peptidase n=1 Tax=Kribbella sp. NPDC026611 TaxID=3154911 RepID=UPI0033F7A445